MHDTQPTKTKSLLEEKLKKVTTERAPVAGQQGGQGGGGARPGGPGREFVEGLVDTARASTGNPVMDQLLSSQGRSAFAMTDPQTPVNNTVSSSGAAAAAGVLTAVDEDGEGDEEAQVPGEFEYFTDGEGDES